MKSHLLILQISKVEISRNKQKLKQEILLLSLLQQNRTKEGKEKEMKTQKQEISNTMVIQNLVLTILKQKCNAIFSLS